MPHMKSDYFTSTPTQAVFKIVEKHFKKYDSCIAPEALLVEIDKISGVSQDIYEAASNIAVSLSNTDIDAVDTDWLVDHTEEFAKERALYMALSQALDISQGNSKEKLSRTAIPTILSDALAIDFSSNLGHDYIINFEDQLDYYHDDVARVSTGVDILDDITNGGFPRKTLNTLVLGTHVGKTLMMTNIAANSYKAGNNILYITLEESEHKIRQRIDANLLDIEMDELIGVDREFYTRRLKALQAKITSRLVVKEYPTASASAMTFKALLEELRVKENFVPDLICLDYVGIALSDRIKGGDNTDTVLKSITEEIRGLAQWANAALVTGQQLNRGGADGNSDPGMGSVAASFSSMFVADFVLIGTAPDELKAKNMVLFIQEKNRHRDKNYRPKIIAGVDPAHMRIYEVDDPDYQPSRDVNSPVFDNTTLGKRNEDKRKQFGSLKR